LLRYLEECDEATIDEAAIKCGRPWVAEQRRRWRAYLTDDEPPEVVVVLP
jgi:hypothetical protein